MLGASLTMCGDFVSFSDLASMKASANALINHYSTLGLQLILSVPLNVGVGASSIVWSSTGGGQVVVTCAGSTLYQSGDTINLHGTVNHGSGSATALEGIHTLTAVSTVNYSNDTLTFSYSAAAGVIAGVTTNDPFAVGPTMAQIAANTTFTTAGAAATTSSYFTGIATALTTAGLTNALARIGWEFNNAVTFAPWCVGTLTTTGMTISDYKNAWNTVAPLFISPGYQTIWCMSAALEPGGVWSTFWPGAAHVSFLGADAYNFHYGTGNLTPADIWNHETYGGTDALSTVIAFSVANSVPWCVCEWGNIITTGGYSGGDSAYYIQQMFRVGVANGCKFFGMYWDVNADGQNGNCSGAFNVTGTLPSNLDDNKILTAAAIRQWFGPTGATQLSAGPINYPPVSVVVNWTVGSMVGGVWNIPIVTTIGTIVGTISASNSNALYLQGCIWYAANNALVVTGTGNLQIQYAHAIATNTTLDISVSNEILTKHGSFPVVIS